MTESKTETGAAPLPQSTLAGLIVTMSGIVVALWLTGLPLWAKIVVTSVVAGFLVAVAGSVAEQHRKRGVR